MICELDIVVLRNDIQEHGLREGDIGTVVHCYPQSSAYEVEFVTAEGKTVAVLTLPETNIRPMSNTEILHARDFSEAA